MLYPHGVVEGDDIVAHRIAQVRGRLANTLGTAHRHGGHAVGVGQLALRQTGTAVGLGKIGRSLAAGQGREVIGRLGRLSSRRGSAGRRCSFRPNAHVGGGEVLGLGQRVGIDGAGIVVEVRGAGELAQVRGRIAALRRRELPAMDVEARDDDDRIRGRGELGDREHRQAGFEPGEHAVAAVEQVIPENEKGLLQAVLANVVDQVLVGSADHEGKTVGSRMRLVRPAVEMVLLRQFAFGHGEVLLRTEPAAQRGSIDGGGDEAPPVRVSADAGGTAAGAGSGTTR